MIKTNLLHPWFITGLIDAEGSFGVVIIKDDSRYSGFAISIFLEMGLNFKDKDLLLRIKNTFGVGYAVQLVFKITQHNRDNELLKGISEYFACGRIENRKTNASDFTVNSFKSFEEKIIPFFTKYPLQGSKLLNFQDFKEVVEIMKEKGHLTEKGLQKINLIKANMNYGREENKE
ncbi:hypothetical protein LEMA_P124260.1 [Plenodomus lingam JN3]|uniref:Homing endonuclease LAGLIDADG domain-containing protein n=1 Tax=Leptosphaeria maculans (strain JN3 / isolate v23.1.3 / race Av1-4-5-6-7-8) TaxID=985895 RepID=E4ZQ98_LEPMJ|nr:hypothetical protein LEMA_P124260.1 [Plenodomus lingam JN3]CBX90008.1 hypothetical protein LEMA_P124260.1 [Plenodomus lingam JN3]